MSDARLLPYGQAATINFTLWETDGTDLKTDAAHASGDTTLMSDEGAEGNTTNGFTDEGTGYSLVLTAAEMAAARLVLYVIDQSTKQWLDRAIVIETYGHPSAQHPWMGMPGPDAGIITAATSTTADLAGTAPTTDDIVNGCMIVITGGTGAPQARNILDYDQANDRVTVQTWAVTPSTDSVYYLFPSPPADTGANAADANLTAAAVDAILDEVVEGSYTLRHYMRLFAAALLGKASGLGTTTAVYRDTADSKDRISATVDADGNRTAVTLTET